MEYYIPSLAALVLAAFLIFFLFPKFTPLILAAFAGAALVYGMYNHYIMFGADYPMMTWVDTARKSAPMIMVGTLIALLMGYLLFMARSGKGATMPSPSYASANTATNPATNAINRGLNLGSNSSRSYNERAA
jgi:hypothetical protein